MSNFIFWKTWAKNLLYTEFSNAFTALGILAAKVEKVKISKTSSKGKTQDLTLISYLDIKIILTEILSESINAQIPKMEVS